MHAGLGRIRVRLSRIRVVIAALAVVAVALAFNGRWSGSVATPERAVAMTMETSPTKAPSVWSFEFHGNPFYRDFPQAEAPPDPPASVITAPPLPETLRLEAARVLRVTSIVTGRSVHAVINKQLLNVGDSIEGFAIVDIQPRCVIVEKAGVRIEVRP